MVSLSSLDMWAVSNNVAVMMVMMIIIATVMTMIMVTTI